MYRQQTSNPLFFKFYTLVINVCNIKQSTLNEKNKEKIMINENSSVNLMPFTLIRLMNFPGSK